MIWFFGVLTIALLAVLAQILLLAQKRSNEFKIRQDPLRQHIESHHSEMEGSFSLGELEKDVTNVRRNIERIGVKMRRKTSVELQEAGESGEEQK